MEGTGRHLASVAIPVACVWCYFVSLFIGDAVCCMKWSVTLLANQLIDIDILCCILVIICPASLQIYK